MLILVRVYTGLAMASCHSNPKARRMSAPEPYWAAHACAKFHFAGAPFDLREATREEIPDEGAEARQEDFAMPGFEVKARHWYLAELLTAKELRTRLSN